MGELDPNSTNIDKLNHEGVNMKHKINDYHEKSNRRHEFHHGHPKFEHGVRHHHDLERFHKQLRFENLYPSYLTWLF